MDPTDTATTESQRTAGDACAVCGDPVSTTEWHPAATKTTADGEVVIVSFCSQDCRDHWTDET